MCGCISRTLQTEDEEIGVDGQGKRRTIKGRRVTDEGDEGKEENRKGCDSICEGKKGKDGREEQTGNMRKERGGGNEKEREELRKGGREGEDWKGEETGTLWNSIVQTIL